MKTANDLLKRLEQITEINGTIQNPAILKTIMEFEQGVIFTTKQRLIDELPVEAYELFGGNA